LSSGNCPSSPVISSSAVLLSPVLFSLSLFSCRDSPSDSGESKEEPPEIPASSFSDFPSTDSSSAKPSSPTLFSPLPFILHPEKVDRTTRIEIKIKRRIKRFFFFV
jgi:hypothetical protein